MEKNYLKKNKQKTKKTNPKKTNEKTTKKQNKNNKKNSKQNKKQTVNKTKQQKNKGYHEPPRAPPRLIACPPSRAIGALFEALTRQPLLDFGSRGRSLAAGNAADCGLWEQVVSTSCGD